MQFRIVGDAIGLDVLGNRFIDIALRQLTIPETGPMSNQFMRQRSRNAGEEQIPDRVLKDGAMPDFEDMAEVRLVAAGPRLGERHIADASGGLDQMFAGDFGVGLPGDAMIGKKRSISASLTVCRPMT